MIRKVVVSPDYGAGWSTWNDDKYREDFLFDPQLIEDLENGVPSQDAADAFKLRMLEKYPEDQHFCILGGARLEVETVGCEFKIDEYDGSETLIRRNDDIWI